MAVIKSKYGTAGQALTCTLAGLANGQARASSAIDNTENLFLDALVEVNIKTATTGVQFTGVVNIYIAATANGGTDYTDGASGADADLTVINAKLIGVIRCGSPNKTFKGGRFSVIAGFNGTMPDHWILIVENKTGNALSATEGDHLKVYQGVWAQTFA